MDFQAGLIKRLVSAPAVTAICGTRIFWVQRPQASDLPAVTLMIVSDPRPGHLKGADGARRTRVQADCRALTYESALGLARAVAGTLIEPASVEGKRFGAADIEGPRDMGDDVPGTGFVHRQSMDLFIWHAGD